MAMSDIPAHAMQQPIDKLVVEDHNKVKYLFQEYKKAPTAEIKQQLAYQIIRELSMHSSKEEEVLYPQIKKVFGDDEYKHVLGEHMELKRSLAKLGEMNADKGEAEFDQQVSMVERVFLHHIQEEEQKELPKLIMSPGIDALELGKDFEKAAAHAVTRPHTWAPDKAPINKVTNMMTAPLDAAADAVRFVGNVPNVNPPTQLGGEMKQQ